MTEPGLEWRVEETCLNAWPALREGLLDGWLLRFSEGLTRRANSANPLRLVLDADVPACEALYHRAGLPTIFRVLSLIDRAVDERLADAGYTEEGESCVLYGPVAAIETAQDPHVRMLDQPTPDWYAAMAALQKHSREQAATYRRIVGQLVIPAAFAVLEDEGTPAALAYAALHKNFLCYESVITDPTRRRRGYGRRIITALAGWGKEQGAVGACLEVEARNSPALALYESVGLRQQLYRYHYRREPAGARRL